MILVIINEVISNIKRFLDEMNKDYSLVRSEGMKSKDK